MNSNKKIKVLWFSNTPANADGFYNNILKGTGGWLKALDKSIQGHVELHVAFYHNKGNKSFRWQNSTYHPINKVEGLLLKCYHKVTNYIPDNDDLHKYFEIINKVKPDIIHIHGTENSFGSVMGKIKIPIVVSIQGNLTVLYHKYFSGIEKEIALKTFFQFQKLKSFPFFKSFKRSYKAFQRRVIIESNSLKNCQNIIGRTSWDYRISRILAPNSRYFQGEEILRDSFYEYEWKEKFDTKLIIHTTNGNFIYKGFETICHSIKLLNKIKVDVEWRVAGISEEDLVVKITREKLKKDYPEKGLTLLGSLDEEKLIKKMLEANIYVMPSHIENSPNNLCEAMMLGMPCIATFVGGVGSLIEDGVEGILIQDGDPWVMAGAILQLYDNREKAIWLGQNARKKALIRHNKERIVHNLVDIYNQVANPESKKPSILLK